MGICPEEGIHQDQRSPGGKPCPVILRPQLGDHRTCRCILGAVLKQRQKTGELKPVAYVSRAMTPTERRYAQIEKEALAFTWACERLDDYLTGLKFHTENDHKPLVPLFSSKHLEELPPQVQRFQLRMMRFAFTITHVPDKELVIPDTFSLAPAADPTLKDGTLQDEAQAFACLVLSNFPAAEH